jgi:hypothetical protein
MTNDQEPMTKQIRSTDEQCSKRVWWLALVIERLRIGACLVLGACSLMLPGCTGSGGQARYVVTGKVTFQGEPVEEGQITFENPEAGQVNSGQLGAGGAYSTELPAGKYKVSVSPPLVETKGTGDSPPDMVPKKMKNLPRKYWVQESSGLAAEVSKEQRKFDFELKP